MIVLETMAHIPTEQEDVDAYGVIVEGTELEGSSISAMLTLDKDDFELTFHDFSPLHKLNLKAMRGRYQERRQGTKSSTKPSFLPAFIFHILIPVFF
jgi:hypothetical protein